MRVLLTVALVPAVLAPAAHTVPETGFAFGRTGGSIMPFTVAVSVGGIVRTSGAAPRHGTVTKDELANLNRVVFETSFTTLPRVTNCRGTLPDVAARFIRVGALTVRVHGTCVPRFNRLWAVLQKSVR